MCVHSSSTHDHNYFPYSVSQESLNTYHTLYTTLGTRANYVTPAHVELNTPKTLTNNYSIISCNCKNAKNENCRMLWEQIMRKSLTRLLSPWSFHFAWSPLVFYKLSLVYSEEEHPKLPPWPFTFHLEHGHRCAFGVAWLPSPLAGRHTWHGGYGWQESPRLP